MLVVLRMNLSTRGLGRRSMRRGRIQPISIKGATEHDLDGHGMGTFTTAVSPSSYISSCNAHNDTMSYVHICRRNTS